MDLENDSLWRLCLGSKALSWIVAEYARIVYCTRCTIILSSWEHDGCVKLQVITISLSDKKISMNAPSSWEIVYLYLYILYSYHYKMIVKYTQSSPVCWNAPLKVFLTVKKKQPLETARLWVWVFSWKGYCLSRAGLWRNLPLKAKVTVCFQREGWAEADACSCQGIVWLEGQYWLNTLT